MRRNSRHPVNSLSDGLLRPRARNRSRYRRAKTIDVIDAMRAGRASALGPGPDESASSRQVWGTASGYAVRACDGGHEGGAEE